MNRQSHLVPGLLLFVLVGAACALLVRMALLEGPPGGGHAHHQGASLEPKKETDTPTKADTPVVYEVGNAVCPIMGNDSNPSTPLVVLEGLGIGICCAACEKDIREDPAGTVRKLLADPKAGPGLKAFLDQHPEITARLGLEAARAPGAGPASRPAVKDKLITHLANPSCPVDAKPSGSRVETRVNGLVVTFCSEGCLETFQEDPDRYLRTASDRDPLLVPVIEAHLDLVRRGGHGPHHACAACQLRSGRPGPCPLCKKTLKQPPDEPPFLLNNGRCPIMGEEIEEGTLIVHEGIGVRICCPSCERTFRQYPEYYLAKLEREQGIRIPRVVEETR